MRSELAGMPEVGEIVAGNYRIRDVIGSGAVGVVYEATHELIGRVVAIKWLQPRLAQDDVLATRFLREARAACAIDHPNVVEVYDAGRDEGSLYLIMERLRGEPLASYFERHPHPPSEVVRTLMPALRGIAAAHELGVVHRDLKPDNIFLAKPRRGRVGGAKVLDFGISKLQDPTLSMQLTMTGAMVGSPYYMAPEQIADSSKVDLRADIFSLGVILYEGLTGQLPFDGASLAKLFHAITTARPVPIRALRPEVPAGLAAAVDRALATDPAARFPDVVSLAHALEPFAEGVTFDSDGDLPSLGELPGESTHVSAGTPGAVTELEVAPTQVAYQTGGQIAGRQAAAGHGAGDHAPGDHGPGDRAGVAARLSEAESKRDTDPTVESDGTSGARAGTAASRASAMIRAGAGGAEDEATRLQIQSPAGRAPGAEASDSKPTPVAVSVAEARTVERGRDAVALSEARTVELDARQHEELLEARRAWEAQSQSGRHPPVAAAPGPLPWSLLVGAGVVVALLVAGLVAALF